MTTRFNDLLQSVRKSYDVVEKTARRLSSVADAHEMAKSRPSSQALRLAEREVQEARASLAKAGRLLKKAQEELKKEEP